MVSILNFVFSLKIQNKTKQHLPIIPDPIIELTTLKTAVNW